MSRVTFPQNPAGIDLFHKRKKKQKRKEKP